MTRHGAADGAPMGLPEPTEEAYRVSSVERPSLLRCCECHAPFQRKLDHDYGSQWEGKVLACPNGHGSIAIWEFSDRSFRRRWRSFWLESSQKLISRHLNRKYARLREFGGFGLRLLLPSASVLLGGVLLLACIGGLAQWQSWDDDDVRYFLALLGLAVVFGGLGIMEFRYWRNRFTAWWHAEQSAPGPAE
jgi:hypothetical protein